MVILYLGKMDGRLHRENVRPKKSGIAEDVDGLFVPRCDEINLFNLNRVPIFWQIGMFQDMGRQLIDRGISSEIPKSNV